MNIEKLQSFFENPTFKYQIKELKDNIPFVKSEKNYIYISGFIYITFVKPKMKKIFDITCKYALENNCENIWLILDSRGGRTVDKNNLVKMIKNCPIPVDCMIIGICASSAMEVAVECRNVYIHYNAKWLIHYPLEQHFKNNGEYTIQPTNSLEEINKTKEYYSKKFNIDEEHTDKILKENKLRNVEEAIKYGFVSGVFYELPEIYNYFNQEKSKKI